MDKIQKTLTRKLIQNKLAHLLLIDGHHNDQTKMSKWCCEIINEYFFNIDQKKRDILNNADVLFIQSENYLAKKFYDKKIITEIMQFLSHTSLVGEKKFIIIDNIKYLSEIHMNKLLKSLEEPPIDLHWFLLNPDGISPIKTVSSRAVSIHYPVIEKVSTKDISSVESIKDLALHKFMEKLKKNYELEDHCAQYLLTNASLSNKIDLIDSLNQYLQIRTHDSEFNYSNNERLLLLHKCFELMA